MMKPLILGRGIKVILIYSLVLLIIELIFIIALKGQRILLPVVAISLLIVGGHLCYRRLRKTWDYYYSQDHLLLKSYWSERKIPLTNIESVQWEYTGVKVNGKRMPKFHMSYKNEEGNPESISFLTDNKSRVAKFKEHMQEKSPETMIWY